MRAGLLAFAILAGAVLLAGGGPPGRRTVLLELFTSEGCSDCPPADALLAALDRTQPVPGAELIVLSEHVDYFNRLGWTDPFSSHQFTLRQEEYADRLHLRGPYTPQLVVDGTGELVGSDRSAALAAVRRALREPKIQVSLSSPARNGNQVSALVDIPAAKNSRAILYAILADSRVSSDVARGENYGRTLTHVSVARVVKRLGEIPLSRHTREDVTFSVPPGAGANGLRIIAFLQDHATGRVLGAAVQRL